MTKKILFCLSCFLVITPELPTQASKVRRTERKKSFKRAKRRSLKKQNKAGASKQSRLMLEKFKTPLLFSSALFLFFWVQDTTSKKPVISQEISFNDGYIVCNEISEFLDDRLYDSLKDEEKKTAENDLKEFRKALRKALPVEGKGLDATQKKWWELLVIPPKVYEKMKETSEFKSVKEEIECIEGYKSEIDAWALRQELGDYINICTSDYTKLASQRGNTFIKAGDLGKHILSCALHPFNPSLVVTGDKHKNVKLWDIEKRKSHPLGQHPGGPFLHSDRIINVYWSPNGSRIVSTYFEGTSNSSIKVWDAESQECLCTKVFDRVSIYNVAFHPSGDFIAIRTYEGIQIWYIDKEEKQLKLHKNWYSFSKSRALCYDPSGKYLACANEKGTVEIYDAQRKTLLKTLEAHEGPVLSISYNASGTCIVSAGQDGTVKIWNAEIESLMWIQKGEERTPLKTLGGHEGPVYNVSYNALDTCIVGTGQDGTVKIWNAETGDSLHTLKEDCGEKHIDEDLSLKRVLCIGKDKKVKIWDCKPLLVTPKPPEWKRGNIRKFYKMSRTLYYENKRPILATKEFRKLIDPYEVATKKSSKSKFSPLLDERLRSYMFMLELIMERGGNVGNAQNIQSEDKYLYRPVELYVALMLLKLRSRLRGFIPRDIEMMIICFALPLSSDLRLRNYIEYPQPLIKEVLSKQCNAASTSHRVR